MMNDKISTPWLAPYGHGRRFAKTVVPNIPEGFERVDESAWDEVPEQDWKYWDDSWEPLNTGGVSINTWRKGGNEEWRAACAHITHFARPVRIPSEIKVPEGGELIPEMAPNHECIYCGKTSTFLLRTIIENDKTRKDYCCDECAKPLPTPPDAIPAVPKGYEFVPESEFATAVPSPIPSLAGLTYGVDGICWKYWHPLNNKWTVINGDGSTTIEDFIGIGNKSLKYFCRPIVLKSNALTPPKGDVLVPRSEWSSWYPPDQWFRFWCPGLECWQEIGNASIGPKSLLERMETIARYRQVKLEEMLVCRPIEPDISYHYRPGKFPRPAFGGKPLSQETLAKLSAIEKEAPFTSSELNELWNPNKPDPYARTFSGVKLDPYRIELLYGPFHPAQAHAIKKLIRAGKSHKTLEQDIREARECLDRWEEMLEEDKDRSALY